MKNLQNIDFNILEQASVMQTWHYACHEIAKRYQAKEKVFIFTDNKEEAERLDNLLWTYAEDSFLPHTIFAADNADTIPIQIGYQQNISKQNNFTTAINLSQSIPDNYEQYRHLIEIVFPEPAKQQLARERFKQYRDQGYSIQTNKMKPT